MVTARVIAHAISLLLTAAGAVVLPFVGIRALLPAIEGNSTGVVNYRGRTITPGIGLVWLLWAAGVGLAAALQGVTVEFIRNATEPADPLRWLFIEGSWPMRAGVMLALVLAAFGFGLADDVFGDRSVRGFRGHVGALAHGRLTTGGLKLLGIGAVSAWASLMIVNGSLATRDEILVPGWRGVAAWIASWALATIVIALTANLLNLMDLRPGRALKVYSLLATVGVAGVYALTFRSALSGADRFAPVTLAYPWLEWAVGAIAALLVVLGPVAAVWRFDLGELSMVGDAGANAAGALAGFMLACSLSLPGLAVAAVLLVALNAASERVSFSEVIASNQLLRWLDGLGRVRGTGDGSDREHDDDVPAGQTRLAAGADDESDGKDGGGI
jgi:hypothetical protein